MKLWYSSAQDAEETWRINSFKINKMMGLGNLIRRGLLVVINDVGGTSRSGNPGAIDFRKQDNVNRNELYFSGPIFSLVFYYWGIPEAATRPRDLRLKQSSPPAGNGLKQWAWFSPAETHRSLLWGGGCHLHWGQNKRLGFQNLSAESLCFKQDLSGRSRFLKLGE